MQFPSYLSGQGTLCSQVLAEPFGDVGGGEGDGDEGGDGAMLKIAVATLPKT